MAAARLGAEVEVISALPEGAAARLAMERVEVRNLRKAGEPHALSVALSTRHDRAFVTFDGANADLEARLLARFSRRLPRARHVHVAMGPRDLQAWAAVLARLRARGVSTSWDFGWHDELPRRRGFRSLLGVLDWVFVNEAEARLYTAARTMTVAVARWRGLARNIVVKRGPLGAIVLAAGAAPLRAPAPRVTVVDTTGAGDAFNGGFLAALVRGALVADCLRAGVVLGSLSTRAAGGLDALPPKEEAAAACRWPSARRGAHR